MKELKSTWENRWTYAGAVIAALSILFFISFQLIELGLPTSNPYTGLWTFLVLPAFLIAGLILMLLGWLCERRRRRRLYPDIHDWPKYPRLDLNTPRHRKQLIIFAFVAMVVILLVSVSSYRGYHYTDSTQFCGQVCHSVMHPEFITYQHSPHARVTCAACHIGPGAGWYVRSKLSGIRQVFAVMFHTYSRPIPTPVHNLRPARETCEECHWPAKFFGAQMINRVNYASDHDNTRMERHILVKTGGGDSSMGPASGIHWHMVLNNSIEYVARDAARQSIPWVRSTDAAGTVRVFRSDGKTAADPRPPGELRRMDCMDCHNRPSHTIDPPTRSVNMSLETGRIDRTLPYIKKITVEALTERYATEEEADLKIEAYIRDFYQKTDSKLATERAASIRQAIAEVRTIYHRSFFPRMNADYRSYPNNIGHKYFNGCFRCHDGKHVSDTKGTISRECTVCHEFQRPVSVAGLQNAFLQGTIEHPLKLEGPHAQLPCSSCHTGGRDPDPTCQGCHTTQTRFSRGEVPVLPGLKATHSIMAEVECEACHDLSKPLTAENIMPQCEACHKKGYGDKLAAWKDEAALSRAKALTALDEIRKNTAAAQSLQALLREMQGAYDVVEQAGAMHNPEFAGTVYDRIIKAAADFRPTATDKK